MQSQHAHVVLASGSPLDFSATAFPSGSFAQCRLGPFAVQVSRREDAYGLQVSAASSQRRTLAAWLQAAGGVLQTVPGTEHLQENA